MMLSTSTTSTAIKQATELTREGGVAAVQFVVILMAIGAMAYLLGRRVLLPIFREYTKSTEARAISDVAVKDTAASLERTGATIAETTKLQMELAEALRSERERLQEQVDRLVQR